MSSPILMPSGKPAPLSTSALCPHCGEGPDRRIRPCAFGVRPEDAHEICGHCGFDFTEGAR